MPCIFQRVRFSEDVVAERVLAFVFRKTKDSPRTGRKKPPNPRKLKDADKEKQASLASSLQNVNETPP